MSTSLRHEVLRNFRKLQRAVLPADQFQRILEAPSSYASFVGIPHAAFPLFLTSREYLYMLDGGLTVREIK